MLEQLKQNWLRAENKQKEFQGWDFSEIAAEFWQEDLEWQYKEIVQTYLTNEMKLLDMGTGGGELLDSFNHPDHLISVTEGWLQNYELLLKTHVPRGVKVVFVDVDDKLNYPDNSFDIILNSHESFDLKEVRRVLKPGGVFITQQVGDLNGINLASRLIPNFKKEGFDLHLSSVVKELKQLDFEILEQNEAYPVQQFLSVEALVYYVRTIDWEFPDFSVATHLEELLFLNEELKRNGFIYNQEHRFYIVSRNHK